jgi:MerR family transcriptional regulator, light-induced transcriptional regulator
MKTYSIQMAAEITGLSAHTIRAWEKRYGALVPDRSENGRRTFSESDLDRLLLLAKLTQIGNPIGQIATLPDQELEELLNKLTQVQRSQNIFTHENSGGNIEQLFSELNRALESFDSNQISSLLEQAKTSLNAQDYALKILAPLTSSMTERYSEKKLTFAKYATLRSMLKFHSADLIYGGVDQHFKSKSKIAITTPEEEYSPFEILISAILCHHHKLNSFFLNNSMPALAAIDAASAIGIDVLILGINAKMSPQIDLNLYLQEILMNRTRNFKIWVVGNKKLNSLTADVKEHIQYFSNYTDLDFALKKIK